MIELEYNVGVHVHCCVELSMLTHWRYCTIPKTGVESSEITKVEKPRRTYHVTLYPDFLDLSFTTAAFSGKSVRADQVGSGPLSDSSSAKLTCTSNRPTLERFKFVARSSWSVYGENSDRVRYRLARYHAIDALPTVWTAAKHERTLRLLVNTHS